MSTAGAGGGRRRAEQGALSQNDLSQNGLSQNGYGALTLIVPQRSPSLRRDNATKEDDEAHLRLAVPAAQSRMKVQAQL